MERNAQKIQDLAKILKNHNGIRDFSLCHDEIRHDEYNIIYDDFSKTYQVSVNGILLSLKNKRSVIDLIETSIY